jgi:hypothetical protein
MSEADPREIANQVIFHREARWSRSSTSDLFNGLRGIKPSSCRGSVANRILRLSVSASLSAESPTPAPPQARPGTRRPPRVRPAVRRVAPPRARPMGLASHPSSLRTILVLGNTRAGIEWRPGAGPNAAGTNTAFAQSPPGIGRKRPSLPGQPLGDRASAVPFGCRKCVPLAGRKDEQESRTAS